MSSRQLKKLQQGSDFILDHDDIEEVVRVKQTPFNPFSILKEEELNLGSEENANEPYFPSITRIPKKKKTYPTKRKSKANAQLRTQDLELSVTGDNLNNLTEDKTICDLQDDRTVLPIDRNLLDYENEERRRFSLKRSSFSTSRIHRIVLIPPRPHFDQLLKRIGTSLDLSIKEDVQNEGKIFNCVRIVYGKKALTAEISMLEAASSGDPQMVMDCLKSWPTHPGSLLLLSIADKSAERYSDAQNRIELALASIEHGLGARFRPGIHSFSYAYYENRILFLLLFSYADLVGRRGCWRSALEIGKLLISLDAPIWKDPTGSLFLLDFYGLQAKEYSWIIKELPRLYKLVYDNDHDLHFPQLDFSVSLAMFLSGDVENASFSLLKAINRFPILACELLRNLEPKNSNLSILERLYLERCSSQWRELTVSRWLSESISSSKSDGSSDKNTPELSREQQLTLCRHAYLSDLSRTYWSLPSWLGSNYSQIWAFDPLPPLYGVHPTPFEELLNEDFESYPNEWNDDGADNSLTFFSWLTSLSQRMDPSEFEWEHRSQTLSNIGYRNGRFEASSLVEANETHDSFQQGYELGATIGYFTTVTNLLNQNESTAHIAIDIIESVKGVFSKTELDNILSISSDCNNPTFFQVFGEDDDRNQNQILRVLSLKKIVDSTLFKYLQD